MESKYEIKSLENDIMPEYQFKIVISGDSGVGKSSIIKYEINNKYDSEKKSSLILEHFFKNFEISEKKIRLQIWDTCGEEAYENIMKTFYRSALCIFLVFSLDDKKSFLNLEKFILDIEKTNSNVSPYIVLIGNKCDKVDERKITKEEIDDFCKKNNIDNYYETSAKIGEGIHQMFQEVVRKLFINYIEPSCSDSFSTQDENMIIKEDFLCGTYCEKCKFCVIF